MEPAPPLGRGRVSDCVSNCSRSVASNACRNTCQRPAKAEFLELTQDMLQRKGTNLRCQPQLFALPRPTWYFGLRAYSAGRAGFRGLAFLTQAACLCGHDGRVPAREGPLAIDPRAGLPSSWRGKLARFVHLRRLAVEEHEIPRHANRAATLQGGPIPASARFAAPLERRTGTNSKRNVSLLRSQTGSIKLPCPARSTNL